MLLLRIIPLAKIPLPQAQILSYYHPRNLDPGSLVLIPLRKKEAWGLVIEAIPLTDKKMEIKKATYEIRPILKIVSEKSGLTDQQINLALWLADYYWTPLGSILLKMMQAPNKAGQSSQPSSNKQTLILVPQISHIQTTLNNLKIKNDQQIAVIHNQLTQKQYAGEWKKIANGQAKIILGTSSTVFLPFANLAKIIVKEAEDQHYHLAQQAPRFDARQAAIKLADLCRAQLIFETSQPTIEILELAKENPLVSLKISPTPKTWPATAIVDMRQEFKEKNFSIFSHSLLESIKKALAAKKQIILFNNRRGTATLTLCQDCGHIINCQNCEAPLVYHLGAIKKSYSNLICHHCGRTEKPPSLCPKCQGHRLKFSGTGAEKVEMEIRKIFPKLKVARLDGDTVKKKRQEIIKDFQAGKTNILIGTQALINLCHELTQDGQPPATLVGIISLDTLLHLPDFRSSENIFQLIIRLGHLAAQELVIQTHSPSNEAIQLAAAHNFADFIKQEVAMRRDFHYPPFARLIKLTYGHPLLVKAKREAEIMTNNLEKFVRHNNWSDVLEIFGPLPAFIARKNKKYLWNIVLKVYHHESPDHDYDFDELKRQLLSLLSPAWLVTIDPKNLL